MIEVFSSGGGTQSTCIAALIVQGRLPKPDFMVIADTGYECETTWNYMDTIVRPAMESVGVHVYRVMASDWASEHARGAYNGETLQIPAFTNQTGDIGKLSGYCSTQWKIRVIDRFLSQVHGITRSKFRKWIGFSLDEWRRVQRMSCGEEYRKGLIRFPLVADVPLKRHEVIREVERMGWPTPPRSRCWMCPNQQDSEWLEMSPADLDKAITFEAQIQEVDPHAWLHKSCTPIAQVDFTEEPGLFDSADYCSSGACFV